MRAFNSGLLVSRLSTHAVQLREDGGSQYFILNCYLMYACSVRECRRVRFAVCARTAGGFSKKVVARSREACVFSRSVCDRAIRAIQGLPVYLCFAHFVGGTV